MHATFDELCRAAFSAYDSGNLPEADRLFREARRRKPDNAAVAGLLGRLRIEQGRFDEAITLTTRAVAIDPWFQASLQQLLHIRTEHCDWTDYDKLVALASDERASIEPLLFLAISDDPAAELRVARKSLTGVIANAPVARRQHHHQRDRDRIRIGYLSGEFRRHATVQLLTELIELHDREHFEVVGISVGRADQSEERQRIVAAFDQFLEGARWTVAEIADAIAKLSLDILVDLSCRASPRHLAALAARPAPIQVNYLGHPGTSGADFYDYLIGDPVVTPLDQQPYFTEKLMLMPDCYQPNDRNRRISSEVPGKSDLGLPEDAMVLAAFNRTAKITPEMFDVWMRLLRDIPGTVLWLMPDLNTPDVELAKANIAKEASSRGVTPERIVYADFRPPANHLARLSVADLCLDSFPYSGHTTTSDALWAGVPVLTRVGRSFASRVAGSILNALGLPELVTSSIEEYEGKARALIGDRPALLSLRHKISANRATAPLFDAPRYCTNIERIYQEMCSRAPA